MINIHNSLVAHFHNMITKKIAKKISKKQSLYSSFVLFNKNKSLLACSSVNLH